MVTKELLVQSLKELNNEIAHLLELMNIENKFDRLLPIVTEIKQLSLDLADRISNSYNLNRGLYFYQKKSNFN